jgi:hypothetical protein
MTVNKDGKSESEMKNEFRAKIEKYVAHVQGQVNRNVSVLKDAIISAIKTSEPLRTSSFSNKRDTITNHLLKEYLNNE